MSLHKNRFGDAAGIRIKCRVMFAKVAIISCLVSCFVARAVDPNPCDPLLRAGAAGGESEPYVPPIFDYTWLPPGITRESLAREVGTGTQSQRYRNARDFLVGMAVPATPSLAFIARRN